MFQYDFKPQNYYSRCSPPISFTRFRDRFNKVRPKFHVEVHAPYIKKDMNALCKVQGEARFQRNDRTLYIVFRIERGAFSNMAEFITLLDVFTLPLALFISVSPSTLITSVLSRLITFFHLCVLGNF
jgi:hypothetical protein